MKGLLAVISALLTVTGVASAAEKDTLVLGMVLEPPHLDPTAGAAAAIREVGYANLFEGLTRLDRTGAVKPALAQSWKISPDGLTYVFQLRTGVKFHDGTPFDCAIVKFSYERAVAEGSVNAQKGLFEPIAKTECPDPLTAVVTLKRPASNLLFNLAWGDAVMVAPSSSATNKANPIGTGPFKFVRWLKGDRVELARSDSYWGTPVTLKSVTFRFISDPSAAVAALAAGDVDAFPNFPAPEALAQFKSDKRFTVEIGVTEGKTILALNNARKPFDDIRVRRAIAHAIDRRALIDGAMSGFGVPIGSHFTPNDSGYVDLTATYPYDPAKAKALLAEAGLAKGLRATIRLPPPIYARRGGEVIAAQLDAVGIKAELVPIEWAQWLEQVFKQSDFDMTIISHTEPMDLDIYARDKYYFNYHSDAYRALYQQYLETADPIAQRDRLRRLQRQLAEDEPNVFLFALAKVGVWDARLKGLWENSPIPANDVTEVTWSQ